MPLEGSGGLGGSGGAAARHASEVRARWEEVRVRDLIREKKHSPQKQGRDHLTASDAEGFAECGTQGTSRERERSGAVRRKRRENGRNRCARFSSSAPPTHPARGENVLADPMSGSNAGEIWCTLKDQLVYPSSTDFC